MLVDFCGPSVLDSFDPNYIGASGHSNNVGELGALYHALFWLREIQHNGDCVIEYDSTYAAQAVRRLQRARMNISLVLKARGLLDELSEYCSITWSKIDSHTGHFLNERADQLANCGAAGITRWGSASPSL